MKRSRNKADLPTKQGMIFQPLIYLVFFFSGFAALMYETAWFRTLNLLFGSSHLAVSVTISVFMLGLALGNALSGRYMGRFSNMLKLYAILEFGIAFFALVFKLMVDWYPTLYVPLAGIATNSSLYLTVLRVLFAALAMIIPTTLMGATLPVLTTLLSRSVNTVGRKISYLYGVNTIGAVLGAGFTGFFFLKVLPISMVTYVAMGLNLFAGGASLLINRWTIPQSKEIDLRPYSLPVAASIDMSDYPWRLVFFGLAISGFCALGYEILWTRVLILFFDASTYSFSIVLISFLLGIGIGGWSFPLLIRFFPGLYGESDNKPGTAIAGFGIVQILIAVTTLIAMQYVVRLPEYSFELPLWLNMRIDSIYSARQISNFLLASALLFIPSFLMGLAVPLAARAHSYWRQSTGKAVGELMAYNTIGAVCGALFTGFFLIYVIGIERSMQLLAVINLALGAVVLVRMSGSRVKTIVTGFVFIVLAVILFTNRTILISWDQSFLATHIVLKKNSIVVKNSQDKEVLYFSEGLESIVSSVRNKKNGVITFIVNGRAEASTDFADVQNQYMLGHLPMLLHPNPKKAFVLGLGSGMTLGAVSAYDSLESLTLAELEPEIIGVAKTFSEWNNDVMSNPRLRIVQNDGRNYLMTSKEKFDVITSDPIHPSWRGSGYLYTSEYFRIAADHLAEGGIMSHWLPLYQLTEEHLRSIFLTFTSHFRYTLAFITFADVQLIGSNSPLEINEHTLDQRILQPKVRDDLKRILIGTSDDLLSHFLMGTKGMKEFSKGGTLNTDDNLYLEFSSPETIGKLSTISPNVKLLAAHRENVINYLSAPDQMNNQLARILKWTAGMQYSKIMDKVHFTSLDILSRNRDKLNPEETKEIRKLMASVPELAHWRVIKMIFEQTIAVK